MLTVLLPIGRMGSLPRIGRNRPPEGPALCIASYPDAAPDGLRTVALYRDSRAGYPPETVPENN